MPRENRAHFPLQLHREPAGTSRRQSQHIPGFHTTFDLQRDDRGVDEQREVLIGTEVFWGKQVMPREGSSRRPVGRPYSSLSPLIMV